MNTKIAPCNLFATPESMEDLQEYLAKFNGNDAIVAQTCAWMAWNLACKFVNPEEKHEKPTAQIHP